MTLMLKNFSKEHPLQLPLITLFVSMKIIYLEQSTEKLINTNIAEMDARFKIKENIQFIPCDCGEES